MVFFMRTKKLAFILVIAMLLTGCTVVKSDTKKEKDLDYTVTDYHEVPKEVQKIIDERKEDKFTTVYSDKENTYILIGYGKKETEGYQIRLDELYESTTDVYVKTTFLGPEDINEAKNVTYPYIIIKIEYTDKNIKVIG